MYARSGKFQVSPERFEEVARSLREEQVPRLREQRSYKGFTLLGDHENGTVLGIGFWESEADRQAAEDVGREARRRTAEAGDSKEEPVIERWEVLYDDMA